MSTVTIRSFHRGDRTDLTRLVNAHVAAVLPGAQLSTQRILAQIEDEPDEIMTNRWVEARVCLVAERDARIVGAALLIRYSEDPSTSDALRGLASLRWLIGDVEDADALDDLVDAAALWANAHGSAALAYDGVLPVPGCFGLPEAWPHVSDALDRANFDAGFDVLHILTKSPKVGEETPEVQRSVGICGTRHTMSDEVGELGFIEVDATDSDRTAFPGSGRFFEVGNFWLRPGARAEVKDRLLAAGENWCFRAGADLLITYVSSDDPREAEWMRTHGFDVVGSCVRGRRRALR